MEKQLRDATNEIANLGRQKEKYLEIKRKITGAQGQPFAGKSRGFLQDLLVAPKTLHAVLESFYFDELDAPIVAEGEAALQPDLRKAFLKRAAAAKLPEAIRAETGFRDFVKNLFELEDRELKPYFRDGVLVDSLKNGLAIFVKYGVDIVTEQGEVIGANGVMIKNRDRGILEVLDEIKAIDKKVAALQGGLAGTRASLDLLAAQEMEKAGLRQKAEAALNSHKEESIALRSRLEALKKNRDLGLQAHPGHRRRDRRPGRGDGKAKGAPGRAGTEEGRAGQAAMKRWSGTRRTSAARARSCCSRSMKRKRKKSIMTMP